MPKVTRTRVGTHAPSVKLPRALPDEPELLPLPQPEPQPKTPDAIQPISKQEKQQLKREAFLQRLRTTDSPYSKSHQRRLKRKAREQIASGMDDMQKAIASLDETLVAQVAAVPDSRPKKSVFLPKVSGKIKPGQIGEGKGATLSENQRKRALQLERLRHPLILANPSFSMNPFETIRTHAQNTLKKHETLPSP